MKKTIALFVGALIGLVLVQCGKKTPEEKIVIQPESAPGTVTLPTFGWEKSIRVQFGTERDSAQAVLMEEEVAAALSEQRSLRVLDRTEKAASAEQPLYTLKGSVKKRGDQYELAALVTDRNDQIVSDQNYLETEENLLTVVEEMASRTTSALLPGKPGQSVQPNPVSSDAINRIAQARLLLEKKNRPANQEAIALFQEALRMDSTLVPALAGLAEGYLQIVDSGWDKSRVFIQLAQAAAQKAVRTAPDDPRGHLYLGKCLIAWGDTRQAEAAFKKALELNPNQPEPWAALGQIYGQIGLYEPALECNAHALALEPDQPDVVAGQALMLAGIRRYEDAEKILDKAIRLHPERRDLSVYLALIQFYQEKRDDARRSLKDAGEPTPLSHAVLGMIEAKSGNLDAALGEIELEVKPAIRGNASLAVAAAAVYTLLGRNGLAVEFLNQALEYGYQDYPWLANDPNFDGVRQDARFIQIMSQLKARWEGNIKRYFENAV